MPSINNHFTFTQFKSNLLFQKKGESRPSFKMTDKPFESTIEQLEIRTKIILLENKLKTEKIKYRKNKLIEQINLIKKEYCSKDRFSKPESDEYVKIEINCKENIENNKLIKKLQNENELQIVEVSDENFDCFNHQQKYSRITFSNLNDKSISEINSDTVEILNCNNTTFHLNANSIILDTLHNCNLTIKSKQLRIRKSSNLRISLFTLTPTVLEKSTKIYIEEHKIDAHGMKNWFLSVKDFDCPFGSKNYVIL